MKDLKELEKIKLIENEQLLDVFCRAIASDIFASNIVSEVKAVQTIKSSININIQVFIQSLLDSMNSRKYLRKLELFDALNKDVITERQYKHEIRLLGKPLVSIPILKAANKKAIIRDRRLNAERYEKIKAELLKIRMGELIAKIESE